MSPVLPMMLLVASTSTSTSIGEVGARPPSGTWPVEVDWVRFGSGEWLNDECVGLRQNKLTFNSDQVGQREWDFDDVTDLVLSQNALFVFTDRTTLQGIGRVTPHRVIVETAFGTANRSRDELLQIIMGEDREWDRWQLRASVGANLSAGNSRQVGVNGDVKTVRRGDVTRFELQYVGAFARSLIEGQPQTTVNNHRGRLAYEWYFTPRFFWRVVDGSSTYDELQGVLLRAQPGTLIGWQPVDDDLTLSVGLGAGYQHTSFIEDIPSINTGGVVGTVEASWSPPGDFDLSASSSAFADLGVDNPSNQTTFYNRLGASVDITSIFDLSFTFIHEFVADPQGGGNVQSNDFQFNVNIGITIN